MFKVNNKKKVPRAQILEYSLHHSHSSVSKTFFQFAIPKKTIANTLVDTGRKLNVIRTFKRHPERRLNVLCTVTFRPVSKGNWLEKISEKSGFSC